MYGLTSVPDLDAMTHENASFKELVKMATLASQWAQMNYSKLVA